jgi:hypothetical protein
VRPNGYRAVERVAAPCDVRRPRRCLRIVHYGNLYQPRLDIVPVISRLAACGRWDTVVLTQQGEDWTGALRRLPPSVRVELRRPQAWSEVVSAATDHDLALVVGNRNPAQLPSKAIQYLTLPIPRLAVVGPHPADALSAYVRGRPGWLTLRQDAPADLAGAAVAAHLSRPRSTELLAPPADESWGSVAQTVLKFTLARAGERARAGAPGPRHAASRAIPAATSSQPR